ncbi:MAG: LLM class flavin-dependent oxidoreductase [Thermomicrobiales bacterium]|nr:LLM class flavin-dependent oxidoreductase [Thermomicrobiales bacterium]
MTARETDATMAAPTGRWPESRRPMSFGIQLPLAESEATVNDSPALGFADFLAMTRAAVDAGFEIIWLPDHLIIELDNVNYGIWECWTTMAALAGAVPEATFGPLVACASFHNPGVIAKMAESLDEITRGRFVLGIGCGWQEAEYEMFGLPFERRVSRFAEAMEIISPLLRTGRADFTGDYYAAHNAVNLPRGPHWREGGAPIMMGAAGPRMMRLTARYADAWNADWHGDPAVVADLMTRLDDACLAEGRDPATLVRTASVMFVGEGTPRNRWQPDPIDGDVAERAAHLRRFRDLGMRHLVVGLDRCTPEAIARFGPVLAAVDRSA